MISCTEFIASYSELFSYIDENHGGHAAVERYWEFHFKPTEKGIPLINYIKQDGLRGAWNYWKKTLTEEAAETTRYMNEKAGWMCSVMHHCPSKGKLLKLQEEIGLVPYYDYCGHCDYYRAHLNEVGLTWIRNHMDVDKASCRTVLYDPKKFKGVVVLDENTEKFELHASELEYFHPEFHNSLNHGIDYVGKNYGLDALKAYLKRYTLNVLKPVIDDMKNDALAAIEKKIRDTYEAEKATDALTIENDGKKLSVKIAYCPAVKYLKSTGREVSEYYIYSTETVMETLAEVGGLKFTMESYDDETGAAAYSFEK